jgi:hypothetical protein
MKNSSPEQKEMLKVIYKTLSKKVVEGKLSDSNIAVYINYNIIQKKEASDVQLKISQYMYGNNDNTFAVVSTSGGDSYSFDVMNKDTLMNSGGISYTNEEGKKIIAALLYKRNSERMSKAVDDALSKQAEEAAEECDKDAKDAKDAKDTEDALCMQSEKKRRTEAPFSTELPIIDKNGKQLSLPFPNFTTHKTQLVIKKEEVTRTKGFIPRSSNTRSISSGSAGITRGGTGRDQEKAEDNTLNADMQKAFDGITITTCAKGNDICEMPLITMKIPNNPSIILQPGNFQVNVVLCCNRHPFEWREANLQTDEEEADAIYFVEEILENMLKARIHLKNELAKVPNSHNTTVLTKADFNHFDKTQPDAEVLLKNSAGDLFNPFNTVMPSFDNDDFDIEKFCQEYGEAKVPDPIPTQESEPVTMELDSIPTQKSEPITTQESEADLMNFVSWDNKETTPQSLLVSLGDKPLCCAAPKIYLKVKQHDGKDDEEGEIINKENIIVIDRGTYREVMYKVVTDQLTKVTIKTTHVLEDITPVYINDTGDEEPESEITLQEDDLYEFPYPLRKDVGEESDSWIIRSGSDILLKITFRLK